MVLVVMGILLAVASGTWSSVVESRRVDTAADQLASDLRLAHTRATNQLADWRVVYRPDGVRVADCPSAGQSADYCLVKNTASGTERIARNLPENVRISGTTLLPDPAAGLVAPSVAGTTRTIKFNADGSAEALGGLEAGATSPTLAVGPSNGASNPRRVVSLNVTTSRVKID